MRSYMMKFCEATVKEPFEVSQGAAWKIMPPVRMGVVTPHLWSA